MNAEEAKNLSEQNEKKEIEKIGSLIKEVANEADHFLNVPSLKYNTQKWLKENGYKVNKNWEGDGWDIRW